MGAPLLRRGLAFWGILLLMRTIPERSTRRPLLGAVSSFACYYGPGALARLADYDVAILQVAHYTPQALATLRAAGVRVAAYLSVGEVTAIEAESAGEAWLLRDPAQGTPVVNPRWGTLLVDCRSAAWQAYLIEVRIPALLGRGAEGLFLDTVDVPEAYPEVRSGLEALLTRLRARFPERPLLINRGFSILNTALTVADGFVFEAFTT